MNESKRSPALFQFARYPSTIIKIIIIAIAIVTVILLLVVIMII